jgi:putative ABC transport system ATP-binding protein
VIVTHDERIAATADRLITMRDGAFIEETRLTRGSGGQLSELVGLEV